VLAGSWRTLLHMYILSYSICAGRTQRVHSADGSTFLATILKV